MHFSGKAWLESRCSQYNAIFGVPGCSYDKMRWSCLFFIFYFLDPINLSTKTLLSTSSKTFLSCNPPSEKFTQILIFEKDQLLTRKIPFWAKITNCTYKIVCDVRFFLDGGAVVESKLLFSWRSAILFYFFIEFEFSIPKCDKTKSHQPWK